MNHQGHEGPQRLSSQDVPSCNLVPWWLWFRDLTYSLGGRIITETSIKRHLMTLKSVVTLLDVLQFANSHTAIVVPELGISVTYDSLRRQVLTMADALASAGIRRGDAWRLRCPMDCRPS